MTVHKSQGLTFNKVILDFGGGGAFTGGQTYVALSRCTSLDGLTLLYPITQRDIIVNSAIVQFSQKFNDTAIINNAIKDAEANVIFKEALIALENMNFHLAIDKFHEGLIIKNILDNPLLKRFVQIKFQRINKLSNNITLLEEKLKRKEEQMHRLALEYVEMAHYSLSMAGHVEKGLDDIGIKSALANYDKALSLYPDLHEAFEGKGDLFNQSKNYDDALNYYMKAYKVSSNNAHLLLKIAIVHLHKNNIHLAGEYLHQALKYDKNNPDVYDTLAICLDKSNMEDLAQEMRDKARRLRKK